MAKSKSVESVPKGSGSKRKKVSLDEPEVHVEEEVERKLKKKKKKNRTAEVEDPLMTISEPECKKQKKSHKDKENTEQKKKRKKQKEEEVAEPAADPKKEEEVMEGEEDLSPEERRVLERKLKKIRKKEEKKRLKEEEVKAKDTVQESKPIAPQQALDYLTCWAENREAWKFQKTRQTWLLQHMFDSDKVPDNSFPVLLLYLEGLCGGSRDTTIQKAEALIKELGVGPEDHDAQKRMQRAREVLQLLS